MSKQIDFTKVKNCVIDTIRVGEMWCNNVLLYVVKKPPTLTISAKSSNNKIKVTGKFNDYENKHRYFDEVQYSTTIKGHGIALRKNQSMNVLTNIMQTIGGLKRVNFSKSNYNDEGEFSFSFSSSEYGSTTTKLWFKVWFCYMDTETNTKKVVYSNVIAGSYNSFL